MDKIQRIKLMMGYDSSKTLNENLKEVLNEDLLMEGEADSAKEAGERFVQALTGGGKAAEESLSKAMNKIGGFKALDGTVIRTFEDLENALKNGKEVNMGDLNNIQTRILRDPSTPANLKSSMVDYFVSKPTVKAEYAGKSLDQIKTEINGLNYPQDVKDLMAQKLSKMAPEVKAGEEGLVAAGAATVKDEAVLKGVPQGEIEFDPSQANGDQIYTKNGVTVVVKANNGPVTLNFGNIATDQATITSNIKETTETQTVNNTVGDNATNVKQNGKTGGKSQTTGKAKRAKKKINGTEQDVSPTPKDEETLEDNIVKPVVVPPKTKLKIKWMYVLGAIGGGWLLYWLCTRGKKEPLPVFSDCLKDLLNNGSGTLLSTTSGDPVVLVKQSGRYPDLDAKGGLWFYHNGRVMTADKGVTKRGTWTCNSGKLQTVAEDTTTGLGYNDALLNTKQTNQTQPATGGDVLKNISIVWDGEARQQQPNPKPTPSPIKYHDCSQKNLDNGDTLEIGCISPLIKNIQDCLISKNIQLTGGADSKFGPSLSAYLGGKKVIDKAEYDRQMALCADQKKADTTAANGDLSDMDDPQKYAEWLASQNSTSGTTTQPELHHGPDSTQAPKQAPANVVAPSAPEETGEQLFKKWVGTYFRNKLFNKKQAVGQNRLFFKGPDLTQADFDKLNQYLQQNGYELSNDEHDKRYGDKYVWRKTGKQAKPAAAEPQVVSEQFIKNIVGKHLRSKL